MTITLHFLLKTNKDLTTKYKNECFLKPLPFTDSKSFDENLTEDDESLINKSVDTIHTN
jgi:hypothetical protein